VQAVPRDARVSGAVPEYAAVCHILGSPPIAARTAPFITDDDFDWPGLLTEAATMSGGEALLLRVAYDLWEAQGVVGLWELPRRLDRRNFDRVLEALALCRSDQTGQLESLAAAA
jgi:hypothetical protein